MNVKLITLLLLSGSLFSSCSKDCSDKEARCQDTPSSGACQAYFQRWFYNENENKCEQIGYSGCEPKGFETQQECEECECN
ncbi:MAG: BPTI/Kunitz-type proteinase inhibitor domain-containing protein [Bacteroidota bacterium]